MRIRLLLLATFAVFVASGSAVAQKFYTPDIQAIIDNHGCAGCHGGSGNLNVSPYSDLMSTGLHAPVVVPGDSNSYLVLKLKGSAGVGNRMPLGGPYLTAAEIRTVIQWIMEGAKEAAVVSDVKGTGSPLRYELSQNYPNPFNPSTAIGFQLAAPAEVRLTVYDTWGREVALLVNERREAGLHAVNFDATGLASGVYIYRLTAGSYNATRKLIVLR